MARIFVLAALLVSLCQAQTYQTGQAQIPIAGPLRSTSPSTVPGRKMVSVLDLDGAFVKSLTIGGLATLQLANNTEATVQLSGGGGGGGGGADGVLTAAVYTPSTKMIVLTTTTPESFTLDLSALRNATEIAALIATWAQAGDTSLIPLAKIPDSIARDSELPDVSTYLERQDLVAGSNVTLTPGAGNAVTIASSGGGGGGGLSSVSSDATLDGDGTAGTPLGIADDGVGTDQLADDAVTQDKLANNSVHAAQIGGNAVGSSEISASAVGTSELADDGVTEAKIADSAVGFQQLAANSVRESGDPSERRRTLRNG